MSLCNIQFHRNAEHKTGEFADYGGNGDGEGYQTGPTQGVCLSDATMNQHLRVKTQVSVQVNDQQAGNFGELARHDVSNGLPQAMNILTYTGSPIVYAGSTTGPAYNEKASALQVTWSLRPKVAKVDIATVGEWCKGNTFGEGHAHGVRNLVTNPDLLSEIESWGTLESEAAQSPASTPGA